MCSLLGSIPVSSATALRHCSRRIRNYAISRCVPACQKIWATGCNGNTLGNPGTDSRYLGGSTSNFCLRVPNSQGNAHLKTHHHRISCTAVAPALIKVDEEEMTAPKEIFLRDYRAPDYLFENVNLLFSLGEAETIVLSTISVKPVTLGTIAPLELQGQDVELISVKIDGKLVSEGEYRKTTSGLTILSPPQERFELQIETRIYPQNNTSLEGLYKSSTSMFCTQCEAEGFRKITYYQDRPDVMSKFVTRIEADKELYPVLLSNGNLVEEGSLPDGKHYAVWEDPWNKPCYLFALVAGKLAVYEDSFTTASGRNVSLRIWVQEQDLGKTSYAMESLKASMKWDEETFGLEYDLDLFNIVAVPDFNMGAMENKSLNIFNSRLVLATPETATDADYTAIEGVVAHEYFHNWTGNRVTCRDWFQLSLKEGLTVYRDQEFSADMNSRAVERITDVMRLRSAQFSQDAGPMAHPVRPESYIKMDNFYTVTVYEKGAEVVRMYESLLGKQGFRKGMDLYFKRHDGQAVTCEDFLAAMRDANQANLNGFSRWLGQAGTPVVTITSSYNEAHHAFTLHCKQETPATPGQPKKLPVLLPLAVGLLSPATGADLPLGHVFDGESLHSFEGSTTAVLKMKKAEQEFTFLDILEVPVPSLLRNFSAPVRLESDVDEEQLRFLLAHDSDNFNRWEAGQTLSRNLMLRLVEAHQKGEAKKVPESFLQAMKSVFEDESLDPAFVARVLSLPGESELSDLMDVADPDAVHAVHNFVTKSIASYLRHLFVDKVKSSRSTASYTPDHASKARRSLKNCCLGFLTSLDEPQYTELAVVEFKRATNMTEQLGALAAITKVKGASRERSLAEFYEQWKDDNLVMNKWLSLQASAAVPGNVHKCKELLSHPAFNIKEPNKVYALLGGFCSCAVNFHARDGSGYEFVADTVIQLDALNAQVAARMVSAFTRWKKFDNARQELAKAQLERILSIENLSPNVYEIVSKSLAA